MNIFKRLTKLEVLCLEQNWISFIHEMALPAVRQLNLADNKLKNIPNYLPPHGAAGTEYNSTTNCGNYSITFVLSRYI